MNALTAQPHTAVGTTPRPVQVIVPTPPVREEAFDAQHKLLMTVEEAAQRLSIGRPKMYELIMQGTVLSVKIGASRRIPTTALEAYVQQLSAEAAASQAALVAKRRENYG